MTARWLPLLGLMMLTACDEGATTSGATTATATATATAAPKPEPKPSASAPKGPPLLNPKAATEKAPDEYEVVLDTTKGEAVIKVHRDWAPRGADRFYNLVKIGYYDGVPFYRVTLEVAQFGIHGDPKVSQAWKEAYIMDEMVKQPNSKKRVAFARRGSDTRTTQVFINLKDNAELFDEQGFAPFGEVVEGFDTVIAKLSNAHGERPQMGDAPKKMMSEGADYIKKEFPKLDWIKDAEIRE